jgi:hypothetical protein
MALMALDPLGARVRATWVAAATTRLMRMTSPSPVRVGWGRPMNAVPTMTARATNRTARTKRPSVKTR